MDDLQERCSPQAREMLRRRKYCRPAGSRHAEGEHHQHVIGMMDRQGVDIIRSRDRLRKSVPMTFSGASNANCLAAGRSASSTAHTTRTCWSSGSTSSPRPPRSSAATCHQRFRGRPGHVGHGNRQVLPQHLAWRAEEAARRAASNPEKFYKYNPGDVSVASKWDAYMDAYSIALSRCNTDAAPWHVVPANRKWYRNWAITHLIIEAMGSLKLGWPEADFDVKAERKRVEALASR